MSIPVVPTPLTPNPPMICGFRYTVNALEFNSYITFNVILLDQTNTPLSVRQVTMAGEDYNNWGNSDQYVIDFICTTLGLTPLDPPIVSPDDPVPVPVPVPVPEPIPEPEVLIPEPEVLIPDDPVPVPVPIIPDDPVPVPVPIIPDDPVPVPEPVSPDNPVPVPEPVSPDNPVPVPEPVVDPFTEPI